MRTLILIVLFGLTMNICYAQVIVNSAEESNVYNEKGDYYFDRNEFKKAIVYFNMAYKNNISDLYSILRKAEAYEKLNLYPQAEECYRIAFESNQRVDNVYRLRYAIVLLANKKPKESKQWLDEYNHFIEEDIKGANYISSAENRIKLYKDSTINIVANVGELNTKESEINPVIYRNQLIFASTRKNLEGDLGKGYYRIFTSSYSENGEFNKIGLFNNYLSTDINNGPLAVSADNKSLYLTRSLSQKSNLKTYRANMPKDANETLDLSEIIIENFNSGIGHPTLNSRGTIMYFISDAPGGVGGMDIYKSRFVDNKWTYPESLGEVINTNGDEMYPSIFNDSILFFASDGHAGFGGLDIFSVNLNFYEKTVVNLGNQVNSEFDDFSLFLTSGGQTGYFSSNRPGGAGKEDIYVVDFLNFKVKYAYRPRRRTTMEEDKINLLVSNGDEYNIAPANNGSFEFSFQPDENYKLIIQREDIKVEEIINNKELTTEQRKRKFLNPPPIQKAEIIVPAGLKYQFSAGQKTISAQYLSALKEIAHNYQNPNENTINLTALAKDLQFSEGEVYTVRFVKDDDQLLKYKGKGESTLYFNEKEISINGESFFVVLPLKTEVSFNIQTDIDGFEQNYSPKKHAIIVDEGPVFKEEGIVTPKWLISMSVNTDSIEEVKPDNRLSAEEISIIPGTEYILTLGKTDPLSGKDDEIIVPLTRGVKYNLSSSHESNADYKGALAKFLTGREGIEPANGEVIDISLLSKELEVQPGEELSFNLLPVKQFGKKPLETEEIKSSLTLDGKVLEITRNQKYTINVPFTINRNVIIQTDLNYIQENFEPDAFTLSLDTISFFSEITVDTTGYGERILSGWLVSMNVNTNSKEEVKKQNRLSAKEVSIIPGKEYILTVYKVDKETGEKSEIIVPLTRKVKYDFTSNPLSEEAYRVSLDKFLEGKDEIETIDGEVIDISLLSKELQIKEGDEISFSLLPVKELFKKPATNVEAMSSLYLDNEVVEFSQIQKYTINVPLNNERQVNIQTDIEHLQKNFEPGSYTLDIDTTSFFSEITVDTSGYGDRVLKEEEIKDPVFDVVTVNFDLNEYLLRPEAKKIVQENVVDELKGDSRLYVTIKGYTDALGDADYNLNLSKKRAESVKEYLKNNGIGENRIRTFSFGESQSLNKGVNWEDLDEAELRKHRKVEIVIYLPE